MARQCTKRHQETLLSRLRWAMGAAGVALVMGAQAESAPFLFEGGNALRIDTPGWESNRDYLVGWPACCAQSKNEPRSAK